MSDLTVKWTPGKEAYYFRESKTIQLRKRGGAWFVIWPTKWQYRITGVRFNRCDSRGHAWELIGLAIALAERYNESH